MSLDTYHATASYHMPRMSPVLSCCRVLREGSWSQPLIGWASGPLASCSHCVLHWHELSPWHLHSNTLVCLDWLQAAVVKGDHTAALCSKAALNYLSALGIDDQWSKSVGHDDVHFLTIPAALILGRRDLNRPTVSRAWKLSRNHDITE